MVRHAARTFKECIHSPYSERGTVDDTNTASHNGLRKRCGCARRTWPKCPHSWHFNFKPRGGIGYRLSLDVELGRHIEGKTEAQTEADRIRTAIRSGTFHPRAVAPLDPSANP